MKCCRIIPKFAAMTDLDLKWAQNEIFIKFELLWKKVCQMDPSNRYILATLIPLGMHLKVNHFKKEYVCPQRDAED